MLREVVIALFIVIFSNAQIAPVVDVTAIAPKNRLREPATASTSSGLVGDGGAVLSKYPLDLKLLSVEVDRGGAGPSLIFEVQVVNAGREPLEFPVDPNLADFEPSSPSVPYAYTSVSVTLFSDSKQRNIFSQSVSLYGSKYVTGSLRELGPAESIRVRARAALKPAGISIIQKRLMIGADLLMQKAAVSQQSGGLHQDSTQVVPEITSVNEVSFSPSS